MAEGGSSIVITLGSSRTAEGTDLATIIRGNWPEADIEADIEAVLDEAGALTGYRVTVAYPDADSVAEAAFRLRDVLVELGCPWSFG